MSLFLIIFLETSFTFIWLGKTGLSVATTVNTPCNLRGVYYKDNTSIW